MTREEQMMAAAEAYAAGAYADEPVCFSTEEAICETINDFVAGWRAADAHPQWIPVEEELPPRQSALSHCSSNVMAGFFGGAGNYVCGAFYDHKEKKWFDSDDDKPLDADGEYRVTHWMPLPAAPRKEDKK